MENPPFFFEEDGQLTSPFRGQSSEFRRRSSKSQTASLRVFEGSAVAARGRARPSEAEPVAMTGCECGSRNDCGPLSSSLTCSE